MPIEPRKTTITKSPVLSQASSIQSPFRIRQLGAGNWGVGHVEGEQCEVYHPGNEAHSGSTIAYRMKGAGANTEDGRLRLAQLEFFFERLKADRSIKRFIYEGNTFLFRDGADVILHVGFKTVLEELKIKRILSRLKYIARKRAGLKVVV